MKTISDLVQGNMNGKIYFPLSEQASRLTHSSLFVNEILHFKQTNNWGEFFHTLV